MTCDINPLLLDGFVDGQLNAREQFDLNTHLMQCQTCKSKVEQLRQIKTQTQQIQPPPLSDSFNMALAAKINTYEQARTAESQAIHDAPGGDTSNRWPWLASAAGVALTVVGMSYLMVNQTSNNDILALDGSVPIIEISQPDQIQQGLVAISLEIETGIDNGSEHAMYWSDEDVDNFERFTVVDDGFQQDSCGSTVGDKACTLGPEFQVATLDVMTSI